MKALMPAALVIGLLGACAGGAAPGAPEAPKSGPAGESVGKLAGTTWAVARVNGVTQPQAALQGAAELTFGADGKLFGSTGCNRVMGSYQHSGESLSVTSLGGTRRGCLDDGVMEREAALRNALQAVTLVRREGDGLELRSADGKQRVQLRPAASDVKP